MPPPAAAKPKPETAEARASRLGAAETAALRDALATRSERLAACEQEQAVSRAAAAELSLELAAARAETARMFEASAREQAAAASCSTALVERLQQEVAALKASLLRAEASSAALKRRHETELAARGAEADMLRAQAAAIAEEAAEGFAELCARLHAQVEKRGVTPGGPGGVHRGAAP